jgi:hypothetical protein
LGPNGTDELRIIHVILMNDFDWDIFQEYWLNLAVPGEYFVLDDSGSGLSFLAGYGVTNLFVPSLFSACGNACVSTLPDADLIGAPVGPYVIESIEQMQCPISGCTDMAACNYQLEASGNDGSCVYDDSCGCMDEAACNYNAFAATDGWCDFITCAGCTQPFACNYDPLAVLEDGDCIFGVTETMSDWTLWSGSPMESLLTQMEDKVIVFQRDATNCASCIEARQAGNVQSLLDEYGPNGSDVIRVVHLIDPWGWDYLTFSEHWLSTMVNGEYFIFADGQMQLSIATWLGLPGNEPVNGEGEIEMNFEMSTLYATCGLECPNGSAIAGVSPLDTSAAMALGALGPCMGGCTDPLACSYDPNALLDNGTCIYFDALGICGGPCTADIDGDGVCDSDDNCADLAACNFSAAANAACQYLDGCGVCNGAGPVYACGCTDFPVGDCDCDGGQLDALGVCNGTCSTDMDNDGICDSEQGCTYVGASNFEADVTVDDGSCIFTDDYCSGDLTSDGYVGVNDLLSLLSQFATVCD